MVNYFKRVIIVSTYQYEILVKKKTLTIELKTKEFIKVYENLLKLSCISLKIN